MGNMNRERKLELILICVIISILAVFMVKYGLEYSSQITPETGDPNYDFMHDCLDDHADETFDVMDFVPRKPIYLVIHCTAKRPNASMTPQQLINFFYNSRKWDRPGYRHYVTRDGKVHTLRKFNGNDVIEYDEMTWGASGYNNISIHIAYEGGLDMSGRASDTRTIEQKASLNALVSFYKGWHPNIKVIGHRDIGKKACPSYDAKREYSDIEVYSELFGGKIDSL